MHAEAYITASYTQASLLLLLGPLLLGGRGLLGAACNGNDGHGRGCLDHAHEMAVPAVVLGQLCAHTNGAAKQGRGATAAGLRPSGAPGWNAIPRRLPCWTATGSCAVSETRPTLLTSSCESTSTLAPLRVITGARMKTAGIARPGAKVALSVVSKESTCAARGGTRSAQLKVVAGDRRH